MHEPGKILVADDDPSFRSSLVALLQAKGHACDTAEDGPEAARLLSTKEFDLLISDLEMPGNEGMRLIRDVPQIAEGLPVIVVTGYPSLETAVQSIQLPVYAYLVKPFEDEELLRHATHAIQDYQGYRAVRKNRLRVAEWNQVLERIEGTLRRGRTGEHRPWEALLDLTLLNVTQSLADLRVFSECAANRQTSERSLDNPAASSRPLLLVNALLETIAVLDRTKNSFKSKELGELRRRLEGLLAAGQDGEPGTG